MVTQSATMPINYGTILDSYLTAVSSIMYLLYYKIKTINRNRYSLLFCSETTDYPTIVGILYLPTEQRSIRGFFYWFRDSFAAFAAVNSNGNDASRIKVND